MVFPSLVAIKNYVHPSSEILQSPKDHTVFQEQVAGFTCETDGGLSGWRINGTVLQELPPEIHDDLDVSVSTTAEGSRVEILTIPARAEYNGTKIQCLVLKIGGHSAESENVTLTVQGICSKRSVYHLQ